MKGDYQACRYDSARDRLGTLLQAVASARSHLTGDERSQLGSVDSVAGHGALLLRGAVAAARAEDRDAAGTMLNEAARAAARLGHDGNDRWTGFGHEQGLSALRTAYRIAPEEIRSRPAVHRIVRDLAAVSRGHTRSQVIDFAADAGIRR